MLDVNLLTCCSLAFMPKLSIQEATTMLLSIVSSISKSFSEPRSLFEDVVVPGPARDFILAVDPWFMASSSPGEACFLCSGDLWLDLERDLDLLASLYSKPNG